MTIRLLLTQTQSYPDSLVPTHTPTDTYVELFPFQTDPDSAFYHTQIHTVSGALTVRLAHIQTRPYTDSFALRLIRSPSITNRLPLTQPHTHTQTKKVLMRGPTVGVFFCSSMLSFLLSLFALFASSHNFIKKALKSLINSIVALLKTVPG